MSVSVLCCMLYACIQLFRSPSWHAEKIIWIPRSITSFHSIGSPLINTELLSIFNAIETYYQEFRPRWSLCRRESRLGFLYLFIMVFERSRSKRTQNWREAVGKHYVWSSGIDFRRIGNPHGKRWRRALDKWGDMYVAEELHRATMLGYSAYWPGWLDCKLWIACPFILLFLLFTYV